MRVLEGVNGVMSSENNDTLVAANLEQFVIAHK